MLLSRRHNAPPLPHRGNGVGEVAATRDDPRVVLGEQLEELDEPGPDGRTLIACRAADQPDQAAEGRLDEIRLYCETDVMNTYLLYCRFQQMRGGFSDLEYRREIAGVREMLAGLDEPHWREYLQAWPEEPTPAAVAADGGPTREQG